VCVFVSKVEDLQFTIEEAAIDKGDIEVLLAVCLHVLLSMSFCLTLSVWLSFALSPGFYVLPSIYTSMSVSLLLCLSSVIHSLN